MVECSSSAKIFSDLFQVGPMDSTQKYLYATTGISPFGVTALGQCYYLNRLLDLYEFQPPSLESPTFFVFLWA